MLEWMQSFGNFLISIGDFLISFFKNVIEIVTLVFKAFVYAGVVLTYIPIQYQVVLIAFVAYCVIVTVIHFGG